MKIAIASGKGGTGKTTVAVGLSSVIDGAVVADCDVEEPNAALFLKPVIKESLKAHVLVPRVDFKKCTFCRKCAVSCRFGAITVIPPSKPGLTGQVLVFDHLCHSCGACITACTDKALSEQPREIGMIEKGNFNNGQLITGRLNIGEAMAPPLIKKVKAEAENAKFLIIDAPPGNSCPMVAAVKDSDYVLLVTEPTPFGLNDLKIAVDTLRQKKLKFGVVINRSGPRDSIIEDFCALEKIKIEARIPFMRKAAEVYSRGGSISGEVPELKAIFEGLGKRLLEYSGGIQ